MGEIVYLFTLIAIGTIPAAAGSIFFDRAELIPNPRRDRLRETLRYWEC